jgi:hypothetical protein
MPEIANVVPGEPVEADWGNDIRDRTLQRYADQTALDASQPFPADGETAWLDDPGLMVCWDGSAWVPLGNVSQPLTTFQQVERDPSGMAQWRRTGAGWITWQIPGGGGMLLDLADAAGGGSIRPLEIAYPSGRVILPFGIADQVLASGTNTARVVLSRDSAAVQHRWAIGSDGSLLMQTSPQPGDTWTTRWTFATTNTEPSVPIRMAGNTGSRLQYKQNSGGTLTPDFDAQWDAFTGSPFPTDQQLYRGAAAVMAEDDPDLLTADTIAPMAALDVGTLLDGIDVQAVTKDGKQGAVMTATDWDYGGSIRPVVSMLVAEVKALRQRVAALEGN